MAKTNAAFMSGVPELLILRLLTQKELYGYELVKEIRLASNESFVLGEGVVYPLLHSLEKKGFLKSKKRLVANRNRIYYSATAKGARRLGILQQEWERITLGIKTVFGEAYVGL